MSTVSWIHISDIHYSQENEAKLKLRLPSFLDAITNLSSLAKDQKLNTATRLLFITGDITFSGAKKEFANAFSLVIKPLCLNANIPHSNIFICPGNHEIIRSKSQANFLRDFLLSKSDNVRKIFSSGHEQYKLNMKAFQTYKAFHLSLLPGHELLDPGYFSVTNLNDIPLSVISLNTAWAGYGGNEDRNKLFIGSAQVSKAFELAKKENAILLLCHHPIDFQDMGWFADDPDNHECISNIQKRSGFIFTGHVHQPNSLNITGIRGHVAVSLAGAFFEDEFHPQRPLSFSAGWINTQKRQYRNFVVSFDPVLNDWKLLWASEISTYGSPASPAKKLGSYPSIRTKDYEKLDRTLDKLANSTRVVWVKGPPGVGKTTFSFGLSTVFFEGQSPIYIQRGDENDPRAIERAIRTHSPDIWFEAWTKYGLPADATVTPELLLDIIAYVLRRNKIWFLIEGGEKFSSTDKPYLFLMLTTLLSVSDGIRAVVTTRQMPEGVSQPPHLIHELDYFTLDDTRHLVKSYLNCSDALKVTVHNRFHGHPMSIHAFLKQIKKTELDDSDEKEILRSLEGIPVDTVNLFGRLWNDLSVDGKGKLIAISDIPELGIPLVVSSSRNNELEESGLLSTYPSSLPNGTRFYVHPLINEVCTPLLESSARPFARYETLEIAYSCGLLKFGPALITSALEINKVDRCAEVLLADGRAWIEVAGIDNSLAAFDSYLRIDSNNLDVLYLRGLCSLFAGEYSNAEKFFAKASATVTASKSFQISVRAELMECSRRQGRIFEAFSELIDIFPYLSDTPSREYSTEAHFAGVSRFLAAHLIRTLGAYNRAIEMYSAAEYCFTLNKGMGDIIERMHCQYARGLCELYSKQKQSIDLRESFSKSSVKSDFLLGLAAFLYGASLLQQGDFEPANRSIEDARSYFRRFCSIAYECRSLCMLGIAAMFTKDNERAYEYFLEVLKLSRKNSPPHLFANALIILLKEHDYAGFLSHLGELLKQGKLPTVASLLRCFMIFSGEMGDLLRQDFSCTAYFLDSESKELKTKRFELRSVDDILVLLKERLNIPDVSEAFPIVE